MQPFRSASLRATLLCPLGLWVACAPEPQGPSIEHEGDLTVVRNHGPSLDSATLARAWSVELPSDGDHPSRVRDLDVSERGDVVVATEAGVVWRIPANGGPVRVFESDRASEGETLSVAMLHDGGMAIVENDASRLRIFTADGSELSRRSLAGDRRPFGRDAVTEDRDGRLWLALAPDSASLADTVHFPRPVYARVTSEGALVDTVLVDNPAPASCATPSQAHYRFGWFEDFRVRHFPKVKWARGANGDVVVGCPAEYAWELVSVDGRRVRSHTVRSPAPVSDPERSSVAVTWTTQMNQLGSDQEWKWTGPSIPTTKPAYHRVLVADDGRVWAWPAGPSEPVDAPAAWPLVGLPAVIYTEPAQGAFDVFEPTGELVGHVRLPDDVPYTGLPGTPDPVLRGDTVWAAYEDTSGSVGVARFHVVWPDA